MSLPHISQPEQRFQLTSDFPEFPQIPNAMRQRFPEMGEWNDQITRWWSVVRENLKRDQQQITDGINAS